MASFWKVVFREPEWLVGAIKRQRVSLAAWDRFCAGRFALTGSAFGLYLSRIGRVSPGLFLGPLARLEDGTRRRSNSIGCRFTKPTIIQRIRNAATLRKRVLLVHHGHWLDTVERIKAKGYKSGDLFLIPGPSLLP